MFSPNFINSTPPRMLLGVAYRCDKPETYGKHPSSKQHNKNFDFLKGNLFLLNIFDFIPS